MNNLTVNVLDVYGLNVVGRHVGLPVNQVLTDVHPDPNHIPAHKLSTLTKLIAAGDERAKIMRQVNAHLEITAPRYWWTQFATHHAGVNLYSGSAMYTIHERRTTQDDFSDRVNWDIIDLFNDILVRGDLNDTGSNLPEGYLQTRLCLVSYQALRRIWLQRRGHELPEWRSFILAIRDIPYTDELIFVEPRNPWRELWRQTSIDKLLPWSDTYDRETRCVFCGHRYPGHTSICPYAKAQAMIIEEITDVVTE